MWIAYNILFALGFSLMLPRFIWRMARRGGYRRGFMQRFGVYEADDLRRLQEMPRLWIHAVSVGEMFVALRLMAEIRAIRPATAFVITTTTSTGHGVAAARLDARDVLLYFPVDFPCITRRVLDRIRPQALILTESEFWPNLIRLAAARGIPVVLANGRISESSQRGYRRVLLFVRPTLQAMRLLLVQTEGDRRRLVELGAAPDRVRVTGTVKYDMASTKADAAGKVAAWLAGYGVTASTPVIVAGSTWPGEERVLLDAWQAVRRDFPETRLVLVPRHAERRADVEADIRSLGLAAVRRSEAAAAPQGDHGQPVLLVDTTGELMDFYACATVVFVGKSLLHHGGQNFIEPALLGRPVVTGPNLENFPDVAAEFGAAGALCQVRDGAELATVLRDLLGNEARRLELGRRGRALVMAKQGAVRAMAEGVRQVVDGDHNR
ncbi:MAG: 3-deoxy-D-manno-octulosonic acid transferase [Lentisphaerae bacterium]|nr:3-deoxy-D-manno-octulosonic acid transferase [Lentisphaerota bacterium]